MEKLKFHPTSVLLICLILSSPVIVPSKASRQFASFFPLGFQYNDSVGVFFSHHTQDFDAISSKPYVYYDIKKNETPVNLDNLGIGTLDSSIEPPGRNDFLSIKNTNNGFRLVKAYLGIIYLVEFSSSQQELTIFKSFDAISTLNSYFNENKTNYEIKINQGFYLDNEIGVIGSLGRLPTKHFTMFFDGDLNLLKIDSFEESTPDQQGFGLFKQNGTYVIYTAEMNQKLVYDDGWSEWENIMNPIFDYSKCTSACFPSVLTIGNMIRVHEYDEKPLKFQVSNINNLTSISEFTVTNQPDVVVAFLLLDEASFITSVLYDNSIELWYHNMTDMSQNLLFSYQNANIGPTSQSYNIGGSIVETDSSYYIFWDQKDASSVNEIYYARILKDFSSIDINQLSHTDQITDDYTDYSIFPNLSFFSMILLIAPVILIIYIIIRNTHVKTSQNQDLTYPENKQNP